MSWSSLVVTKDDVDIAPAPNGRIYAIPHSAQSVLIIDPVAASTDTTTLGGLERIADALHNTRIFAEVDGGGGAVPSSKMAGQRAGIARPTARQGSCRNRTRLSKAVRRCSGSNHAVLSFGNARSGRCLAAMHYCPVRRACES